RGNARARFRAPEVVRPRIAVDLGSTGSVDHGPGNAHQQCLPNGIRRSILGPGSGEATTSSAPAIQQSGSSVVLHLPAGKQVASSTSTAIAGSFAVTASGRAHHSNSGGA